jgi:hypothetical protein
VYVATSWRGLRPATIGGLVEEVAFVHVFSSISGSDIVIRSHDLYILAAVFCVPIGAL